MKWGIYFLAALLGSYLGSLLVPQEEPTEVVEDIVAKHTTRYRSYSPSSRQVSRYLSVSAEKLENIESFEELTMEMATEQRSPLRMRSVLGLRIRQMTIEELTECLKAGEIRTGKEFAEAGRYLTEMDPDHVFELLRSYTIRFGTMDNFYAFDNAMIDVFVQRDPEDLLVKLQSMERGGSQQDTSLRFSKHWAWHDPAAAAKHFNDLVYLRNMEIRGDAQLRPDSEKFANILMRSWKRKDPEALASYIDDMEEGRRKELFLKVWQQQLK